MIRMRLLLLLALGIALVPSRAWALTGADLFRYCVELKAEKMAGVACSSYIRGFLDGAAITTFLAQDGQKLCLPSAGVSLEQGRLLIEKALRERPEMLHLEAGYLFGFVLEKTFRCRPN